MCNCELKSSFSFLGGADMFSELRVYISRLCLFSQNVRYGPGFTDRD